MNDSDNQESPSQNDHRHRRGGAWWGLILIFIGAIFLLQNIGLVGEHFNWWAIFIFLPAFGSLSGAWYAYQKSKRFNMAVRSTLGGGLVVLTVAIMLLFGVDWTKWWPLMLVAPGLSLILNSIPDSERTGITLRAYAGLGVWTGISVSLLGLTFLVNNLNLINLQETFGSFRWWGIFILIPGFGGILNGLILYLKSDPSSRLPATGLFVIGAVICAVGGLAISGLSWNLLTPIILIGAGLALLAGYFFRQPA